MAKAVLVVLSQPSSTDVEDAYNNWYTNVHLPDLLDVPQVLSATRYKLVPGIDAPAAKIAALEGQPNLAIYDLITDDAQAVCNELEKRIADGRIRMENSGIGMDPPPTAAFYVSLSS